MRLSYRDEDGVFWVCPACEFIQINLIILPELSLKTVSLKKISLQETRVLWLHAYTKVRAQIVKI